jgi:hypothetical protein
MIALNNSQKGSQRQMTWDDDFGILITEHMTTGTQFSTEDMSNTTDSD